MNSQMLLGSVMESMRTRDADGVDSRRSVLDTETPATAVEKVGSLLALCTRENDQFCLLV